MDKVLVLMSTYNGERYLAEQIDSILSQEKVTVTLLIRDDGSTDHTINIIKEYHNFYPDKIFIVCEKNIGFAMSFTKLLQIAHENFFDYPYYAFSDQDDVWLPLKLISAICRLKNESDIIPITYCSNTKLVDSNLIYIKPGRKRKTVRLSKERAIVQNFATGCTMVFNKCALEMYINHLPKKIKVHDFLMYQLCIFIGKVIYDENSYILYRQHANNQIGMPNFWGRWKRRFRKHYKEHTLEFQNYYFLEAYKNLLNIEDVYIISQIVFYRKCIFNRLSLVFNRKIKYTVFERNIFFIIKIILGWV